MVSASESRGLRVLVTGLSGFTGRYVKAELERVGHTVHGLSGEHNNDIDLLDRSAVEQAVNATQPQAVIHLAGVSFAAHDDVDAIYRTNVVGTHYLLTALAGLASPPSTVVLASSAHVYGNGQAGFGEEHALDESTPLAPSNAYAVSKLAMEFMARTWSEKLSILLTRPFNYTGVGQAGRFLIPKIVDHFRRGERRIELGNLDVWREFMDVRMVAWVYRRLLETGSSTETLNICSGASHSLREVIGMMEEIAGYQIDVSVNPAFVRENEMRRLEGNPARLQARIGVPAAYSLRDTLCWMYGSVEPAPAG